MKLKEIIAIGLILVLLLSGCSQGADTQPPSGNGLENEEVNDSDIPFPEIEEGEEEPPQLPF